MWPSLAACTATASTHRGSATPMELTPMPEVKSMYSLPSALQRVAFFPWSMSTGKRP